MKKILVGCFLFPVLIVLSAAFEVPRAIFVGWLFFLLHTLPRITVDWSSVFVGCLALLLFTAGVHGAGRAWRRNEPDVPRWKFCWSSAAVAVVFLLFAAGISLVGIVHQVGWLLKSPEPYYVQTVHPVRLGGGNPQSNLRQLALALANYTDTYGGCPLPAGAFTPDGRMLHSWETRLLPFFNYASFGEDGEDTRIDYTLPWNHPRNEKAFKSILPEFINTSLPSPPVLDGQGFGLSHYSVNSHVMGATKSMRLQDITDGIANTLLVGEINADFKPWGHPVNWRDPAKGINRSPRGFGGPPSAGGAYFSMADGSVRFVSERIHPNVLRALSTPAGGEEMDASALESLR